MGRQTSSLGEASKECPACGEEFRLWSPYDDQSYVRHLESHLASKEEH